MDDPRRELIDLATTTAREVARLRAIEARALEWFRDTDLAHPSVTEAAIHSAMGEVLHGPG